MGRKGNAKRHGSAHSGGRHALRGQWDFSFKPKLSSSCTRFHLTHLNQPNHTATVIIVSGTVTATYIHHNEFTWNPDGGPGLTEKNTIPKSVCMGRMSVVMIYGKLWSPHSNESGRQKSHGQGSYRFHGIAVSLRLKGNSSGRIGNGNICPAVILGNKVCNLRSSTSAAIQVVHFVEGYSLRLIEFESDSVAS